MFSSRNAVLVAGFPFVLFSIVWICEGQPETQSVLSFAFVYPYVIAAFLNRCNWSRRNKPSNVYVYVVLEDAPLAFPEECDKAVNLLMSFQKRPRKRHKSGGCWLKRKKGHVWRSC